MPRYLFEAKYNAEGVRGLKEAGAPSRAKAVNDMATGLGGSLEAFYFAFGDVSTIKLLTVDEADAAIARSVDYRPPGR